MEMKQKLTKKLITLALMAGILVSAAVPAMRVKAAEKEEVWVLASKTSEFNKYKYTYNKKGLLVKESCVKSNGGIPSYEYAYNGTKISKRFQILDGSRSEDARYTYNKKGYLVKKASGSGEDGASEYKWKNGQCVKASYITLSYDKNGWIIKIDTGSGSPGVMTYDRHGYILSRGTGSNDMEGMANTYKDGRLARQAELDQNGEEYAGAYTFKYTKITVPASVVEKVKKQQDWLTNKGNFQTLPLAAF